MAAASWSTCPRRLEQRSAAAIAKSRKDVAQAASLLEILAVDQPERLRHAWEELLARGPGWRDRALAAHARLPVPPSRK